MSKPKIKSIENNRIVLEPFSHNFISDNYLAWMNDKETTKFIQKAKENMSIDDLYSFVNKMIHSEEDYFFAILLKKDLQHVGNVRLGPIDFNLMKSGFGIMIGDKNFHRCGIGTEVMGLIKDFSFNYLQLKRLCFPAVKSYSAAMSLYSKAGFKCLGDMEKTFDKNGKSWKLVEWTMKNPRLTNA